MHDCSRSILDLAARVFAYRRPILIALISPGQPANDSRRTTSIKMGATPAVRAWARANAPAERTVFRFVRDKLFNLFNTNKLFNFQAKQQNSNSPFYLSNTINCIHAYGNGNDTCILV